jgi:hypothetical protein
LRRARASIRGLSRRAHRILGTRIVSNERDAAAGGVRRGRDVLSNENDIMARPRDDDEIRVEIPSRETRD